ncbi:hypothetical protein MAR_028054, partial [Mya arenaria]
MKNGSSECECVRGYKTHDNGTCVVSEKFDKHKASIRLDYTLRPGENLNASTTYKMYLQELTERRMSSDWKEGSLIIEFVIVSTKDDFVQRTLSLALVKLSQSSSFEVFGQKATVLRVGVGEND